MLTCLLQALCYKLLLHAMSAWLVIRTRQHPAISPSTSCSVRANAVLAFMLGVFISIMKCLGQIPENSGARYGVCNASISEWGVLWQCADRFRGNALCWYEMTSHVLKMKTIKAVQRKH